MKQLVVTIVILLLIAPAWAADGALTLAANQAFIMANAKKQGVISLPSGLQYRVVRSGNGIGNRPGPTDIVQIEYNARLINGAVFDGSSPGLPVNLGVGNLIRGLSEALQLMHEGDHWELVVPPNLAFGAHGTPNNAVPPDQSVVVDLTLVSITRAATAVPDPDQFSITAMGREQGLTRKQGAILTIPQ